MSESTDVLVIGAGIVGLACAWAAAKRGRSVTVLERGGRPQGASIRNFGMIWPIGQPVGERHRQALRSRGLWLQMAQEAGLWHQESGSIHLAIRPDELAVLEEFTAHSRDWEVNAELWTKKRVLEQCPAAHPTHVLAGMWSPTEVCVNPREALTKIPAYLARRWGVKFCFHTPAQAIEGAEVRAADGRRWKAGRVFVCTGEDLRLLFPEVYASSGLRRCKLQMLSTAPQPEGWRIGPLLASGLTLRHYAIFQICRSLAALQERIAAETPELDRYGVHVMVAQHATGEVTLGDSHEYDEAIEPFDKELVNDLILRHVREFFRLKDWTIQERWHGLYAKHPTEPQFIAEPVPGVVVINALGGAGMTRSFGLVEDLWPCWE